ncbi:helix-turn-helix domain-containing protein [Phenylobacterium sp.]|uniref:helix-turn-helix domain-containing protein n=1 Tax=Phenylobacterium sp. TaxID=1871053 RepID=UPI002FC59B7A
MTAAEVEHMVAIADVQGRDGPQVLGPSLARHDEGDQRVCRPPSTSRVRIETAKCMLEAGNQSLEQIAISVGFSESQAFQRAFRIIAGCTLGAYRSRFGVGAAQRFA